MLYLVAFLMLGAALVLLQISKRKTAKSETQRKSTASEKVSQFASVKLACDNHACKFAQDMRGKTFLASEAPTLPLAACDASHCNCRYTKAADRRGTDDGRRAQDIGIQPLIFDGVEHRQNDRRAS